MRTYEERFVKKESFLKIPNDAFVNKDIIRKSVLHCYSTIDSIDENLRLNGAPSLSELIERANLSSFIGNILGTGYEKNSDGIYMRNKPNSFPDLIPCNKNYTGIEIKTAYNRNCPKGHLPKEGYYLIYRYDLTDENGQKNTGEESNWKTVTIWEIRFGFVSTDGFCFSNTKKDSGKTASINISSLNKLPVLYFDPYISPYQKTREIY